MSIVTNRTVKVAAVQAAPVFFDLDACLVKAKQFVDQAAAQGCDLVAFGEAWFPGYPFQIWLGAPAWGMQFTTRFFDNSLEAGSSQFARLCALARDANIMISAGISERDGGSLYLSQVLIGKDGEVESLRRKLKPTHVERSVFGEGYGKDLAVTETEIGRVGQLCCWEHIQPLSKYALFSQNEQIHIAGWPAFTLYKGNAHALGAEVNMAASQVYAVEGQVFVVAATSVIDKAALELFKVGEEVPPFLEEGGGSAMIFAPDGRRLAEYIPETEEGLVVAEINFDDITMAKSIADPAGHYAKPEATQLILDRRSVDPVVILEDEDEDEDHGQADSQAQHWVTDGVESE